MTASSPCQSRTKPTKPRTGVFVAVLAAGENRSSTTPFGTTRTRSGMAPAASTWPRSTSVTASTLSAVRQTKLSAARAAARSFRPPYFARSSASGAFTSTKNGIFVRRASQAPAR
jgi:hypothetical protein